MKGAKAPRRKRATGVSPAAAIKAESKLEMLMALQIAQSPVVPEPVREHRFLPPRRFRFDFAWPDDLLAVEVDGGTWRGTGRHSRGLGYERDCEKLNLAAMNGWTVLRYTSSMVRDGRAIQQLEEIWRKS